MAQAEQAGYDVGMKETKDALRAQVTEVCRGYYLQVWTKALKLTGVDASSELRKPKNIFYPLALQIAAQPTLEKTTTPTSLPADQPANATTASSKPTKEAKVEHFNPTPAANT